MVDIFTILLPHAIMALAVWRVLARDDLDNDPLFPKKAESFRRDR